MTYCFVGIFGGLAEPSPKTAKQASASKSRQPGGPLNTASPAGKLTLPAALVTLLQLWPLLFCFSPAVLPLSLPV